MASTLPELFRQTRKDKGLSQEGLAAKLGLRQSQISDIERGIVDPRFSTIRDVGRALDLEVMLIPRAMIPAIEGLVRGRAASARRPLYSLDEMNELDTVDEGGDEGVDKGGGEKTDKQSVSVSRVAPPSAPPRRRRKKPKTKGRAG